MRKFFKQLKEHYDVNIKIARTDDEVIAYSKMIKDKGGADLFIGLAHGLKDKIILNRAKEEKNYLDKSDDLKFVSEILKPDGRYFLFSCSTADLRYYENIADEFIKNNPNVKGYFSKFP